MNSGSPSRDVPDRSRNGILLGAAAVGFWSFGSTLIFLGARQAGIWVFVALSSLTGGVLQLLARRSSAGGFQTALRLPWRLWLGPVLCFVLYGLAWPCALASSSATQVYGVSLINYLWPILTVLFSAWWVPGVRLDRRLLTAMLLALAGLVCANYTQLRELFSAPVGPEASPWQRWIPYALALSAAVTWGIYSALLVRWRDWARDYVTSPAGFILTGLVAGAVAGFRAKPLEGLTVAGGLLILLYGAGPLAAGYLLWELALPRAKVQTLSLVAAATPVLSTLLLCVFLKSMPGVELALAALLVSAGVVLSMRE